MVFQIGTKYWITLKMRFANVNICVSHLFKYICMHFLARFMYNSCRIKGLCIDTPHFCKFGSILSHSLTLSLALPLCLLYFSLSINSYRFAMNYVNG